MFLIPICFFIIDRIERFSSLFSLSRILAPFVLLLLSCCAVGRELPCQYGVDSYYGFMPTFYRCKLSSADMSENFKPTHSFSGSPAKKSGAMIFHINALSQLDYLPKQILDDFPKLIGIMIENCETFTTIREDFFVEEFKVLLKLNLAANKIATIEANAFQHLSKLKWIGLSQNQLSSLPHQLFKNNPELVSIWLDQNKINSITPDLFMNLNKLRLVDLRGNQCISKKFGCDSESCLVSQEELNSDLSACH